jgi:DNA polymerase III delta subunit
VAPELKPVYLLSGTDRPKIEEALRRLRARVGAEWAEVLSAAESSGDDAVATCNAPGLFSAEARAVVVHGVESWKAADAKAIAAYLADPAPATVLALVGDGVKKDSPLAKACAKAGELLFYDVTKSKLPTWVAERFRALGGSADREACRLLVEGVGENVTELETEIRKLVTWADGETVDASAVEALAAGRAEVPIFALTDAWGARDVPAVLHAVESILERASGTRRDEIPKIVGRIAAHGHAAIRTTCRSCSRRPRISAPRSSATRSSESRNSTSRSRAARGCRPSSSSTARSQTRPARPARNGGLRPAA